jgi:hypothetical protein
VLFDDNRKAVGVEYLKASVCIRRTRAERRPGEMRLARARREVILAGGVFNSRSS